MQLIFLNQPFLKININIMRMLVLSSMWSSKDSENKAAFLNKTEGGDFIISVMAWSTVKFFPLLKSTFKNSLFKVHLKHSETTKYQEVKQDSFIGCIQIKRITKLEWPFVSVQQESTRQEHSSLKLFLSFVYHFSNVSEGK